MTATIINTESITIDKTYLPDIESLRHRLNALAKAIDTSLLPTSFDSEKDFIQEVIAIQFSRRFSNCGTEAALDLLVSDHHTVMSYCSTSGTVVDVRTCRNDNNEISQIIVEVSVPAHRAQPGRCHYEAITRALWQWSYEEDGNKDIPQPLWVKYDEYWSEARRNKWAKVSEYLTPLGFIYTETPLGHYWLSDQAAVVVESKDRVSCWLSSLTGLHLAYVDRLEEITPEFIAAKLTRKAARLGRQVRNTEPEHDDNYQEYTEEDLEAEEA